MLTIGGIEMSKTRATIANIKITQITHKMRGDKYKQLTKGQETTDVQKLPLLSSTYQNTRPNRSHMTSSTTLSVAILG